MLSACERWEKLSGGAFNVRIGELAAAWEAAARDNRPPGDTQLTALVARAAKPGWRIDRQAGTVPRLTSVPLRLDALAKGYITEKALFRRGREARPGLVGTLLGSAVTSPCEARPSTPGEPVSLGPSACETPTVPTIATRCCRVSGRAAVPSPPAGPTTAATQSATNDTPASWTREPADPPTEFVAHGCRDRLCDRRRPGDRPVRPGPPCRGETRRQGPRRRLADCDCRRQTTPKHAVFERSNCPHGPRPPPQGGRLWPKGYELRITLALARPRTFRYSRPLVAVWVEDPAGRHVTTLAVWGRASTSAR